MTNDKFVIIDLWNNCIVKGDDDSVMEFDDRPSALQETRNLVCSGDLLLFEWMICPRSEAEKHLGE